MSIYLRVQTSWEYYIQCQDGFWDKLSLEIECKVWIDGSQSIDEVVFEVLNGTFYEVAAMDSCGCELEVDAFRGREVLQGSGAFIVKALETWFEAVVF